MFPVFGGLESHGDVAFGAVSRKRAALRYADLRRTQGGGGGGGGVHISMCRPKGYGFGAIVLREQERVNVKKKIA